MGGELLRVQWAGLFKITEQGKRKRGFGIIPPGIGEGCSVMNETIFSKPNDKRRE